MSNPFERKFKTFATELGAKTAQDHAAVTATHSGEVFRDKPFSEEYRTLYGVAKIGQAVAQIVTFCTTAALGIFALTHIIPLFWGIYLAVPLGIVFAFGVERVKRTTLAIAAKHQLKYKTFGFVGVVALLTLCVSIAAALYGAKELPGVVYANPERAVDNTAVTALNADIDKIQADIDRLQTSLKTGGNWVAENRTLPKLQQQRTALVERRDAANGAAEWRAQAKYTDATIDRNEKVEKMQAYSVGAAIVAELVFLLCTAFVLYYLFRHFAEQQAADQQPTTTTNAAASSGAAAHPQRNGAHVPAAHNLRATAESVRYTVPAFPQDTQNVTQNVTSGNLRTCAHCNDSYTYGHARQKYCSEICRIAAWQSRTGRIFNKQRSEL